MGATGSQKITLNLAGNRVPTVPIEKPEFWLPYSTPKRLRHGRGKTVGFTDVLRHSLVPGRMRRRLDWHLLAKYFFSTASARDFRFDFSFLCPSASRIDAAIQR
jgi:hypothetical protein